MQLCTSCFYSCKAPQLTDIFKQLRGNTKALHVVVIANGDVLDVYIYFFGHLKPYRAGSEKKQKKRTT